MYRPADEGDLQLLLCLFPGAHINPAVTVTMATIGRFPWKKVPFYIIAQFLGAFMAAACVFGVYHGKFNVAIRYYGRSKSLVLLLI